MDKGERYGQLTIICKAPSRITKSGRVTYYYLCQCDCGNTKEVNDNNLRSGVIQSCGCKKSELLKKKNFKHGGCERHHMDRLYLIWASMKNRCQNEKVRAFKYYGGRGIKVCPEWCDYETFKEWAYESGYDENANRFKCTIDRIDCDGNYEPNNCRWVDMKTQNLNKHKKGYLLVKKEEQNG